MRRSFKTEINPTSEQIAKINRTIGVCRYVYNFYLAHNKERYDRGEKFMSGKSFSVWLNKEYLPNNPKDCLSERHRIKIPTIGWVKLKEKGYIPTTKDGWMIKSGTVSKKAGRYYVSVMVEVLNVEMENNSKEGIGIDLGLKDFAIVSNGKRYKNINKSCRVKKLEKQLRRAQRSLSRKYKNAKKGESTQKNIQKLKLKVQKLRHQLDHIRTDYVNQTIAEIVKTKPSYITIEDLNVSGMMKNRHLSKAVVSQKFYEFRRKLK